MAKRDFYASAFGAAYSFYMERPALARRISRALWGGRLGRYYDSMAAIGEVEAGGTVVDCPCGAGVAFGRVPPRPGVRYVAVDLSPSMLARARSRAAERGIANLELVRAEAAHLPLPSASADLFLSFWGLHCFPDPQAAIGEAARIAKSGSRLVGSTFVRGADALRDRLLIRPGLGDFGRLATRSEVERWLTAAGFGVASLSSSGPMLFFDARRTG